MKSVAQQNTHHMSGRSETAQGRQGDQIFEEHRMRSVVARWFEILVEGAKAPRRFTALFIHSWGRKFRIAVVCSSNKPEKQWSIENTKKMQRWTT